MLIICYRAVSTEQKVKLELKTEPVSKDVKDDSLGNSLNTILKEWQLKNRILQAQGTIFCLLNSFQEWATLNWHFANLEGPCGADLSLLSLHHWDQDDPFEFGGDHCLLQQGYGCLVNSLSADIDIRLNTVVSQVEIPTEASEKIKISVTSASKTDVVEADVILCTLPLGVLKAE